MKKKCISQFTQNGYKEIDIKLNENHTKLLFIKY